MKFPARYRCLSIAGIVSGNFSVSPVQFGDRKNIMRWRNEQIDILRQKQVLTSKCQDEYFSSTVRSWYSDMSPDNLLFSIHEGCEIIGYGGLVHIDWFSKNSEISFLLKNSEYKSVYYSENFEKFLRIIEMVAKFLMLIKIYTVGFDLHRNRFSALHNLNYKNEARLKNQHSVNGELHDILIYGKYLKPE